MNLRVRILKKFNELSDDEQIIELEKYKQLKESPLTEDDLIIMETIVRNKRLELICDEQSCTIKNNEYIEETNNSNNSNNEEQINEAKVTRDQPLRTETIKELFFEYLTKRLLYNVNSKLAQKITKIISDDVEFKKMNSNDNIEPDEKIDLPKYLTKFLNRIDFKRFKKNDFTNLYYSFSIENNKDKENDISNYKGLTENQIILLFLIYNTIYVEDPEKLKLPNTFKENTLYKIIVKHKHSILELLTKEKKEFDKFIRIKNDIEEIHNQIDLFLNDKGIANFKTSLFTDLRQKEKAIKNEKFKDFINTDSDNISKLIRTMKYKFNMLIELKDRGVETNILQTAIDSLKDDYKKLVKEFNSENYDDIIKDLKLDSTKKTLNELKKDIENDKGEIDKLSEKNIKELKIDSYIKNLTDLNSLLNDLYTKEHDLNTEHNLIANDDFIRILLIKEIRKNELEKELKDILKDKPNSDIDIDDVAEQYLNKLKENASLFKTSHEISNIKTNNIIKTINSFWKELYAFDSDFAKKLVLFKDSGEGEGERLIQFIFPSAKVSGFANSYDIEFPGVGKFEVKAFNENVPIKIAKEGRATNMDNLVTLQHLLNSINKVFNNDINLKILEKMFKTAKIKNADKTLKELKDRLNDKLGSTKTIYSALRDGEVSKGAISKIDEFIEFFKNDILEAIKNNNYKYAKIVDGNENKVYVIDEMDDNGKDELKIKYRVIDTKAEKELIEALSKIFDEAKLFREKNLTKIFDDFSKILSKVFEKHPIIVIKDIKKLPTSTTTAEESNNEVDKEKKENTDPLSEQITTYDKLITKVEIDRITMGHVKVKPII